MVRRSASPLFSLPTEIIQLILAYIPSKDLSHGVEMTCKELRNLMIPIYRLRYGHEPAPSSPVSNSCWKRFAIQHEFHRCDSDDTRDERVEFLLETYSEGPEHYVLQFTEAAVYYLHNNPHVHSRGIEAIVAALNIQHRHHDSAAFLERYRDAMSFESMAILQARFNLHFDVSWSACAPDELRRCLVAAVTSGNVELFAHLQQCLLEAGEDPQVGPAVEAALYSDRVEILRNIQSTFRVEFDALPLGVSMEEAVEFGSANAIQFILDHRHGINLQELYEVALYLCNLDILRRLQKHSPDIVKSYLPNGELQIAYVLESDCASWANKSDTIEFLVKHASVDINAIRKDGLAVVHIAAIRNNIDALKLFENLGADLFSLGNAGQTPSEMAICKGHDISFIACSSLPINLLATKRYMAKAIIGKIYDASFETQRNFSSFDRLLYDAKSKLADIWVINIGIETLQGLFDIIGTPLFESVTKFQGIIARFSSSRIELGEEEQLRDVDHIKDILKRFLGCELPDEALTDLAYYSGPELVRSDIEQLGIFVNSKIGGDLHRRKCSFLREEQKIWLDFGTAVIEIARKEFQKPPELRNELAITAFTSCFHMSIITSPFTR